MNHDHIDHTLATIDGALRDYETSGDAMRWTPEPETATEPSHTGAATTALWIPDVGGPIDLAQYADFRPRFAVGVTGVEQHMRRVFDTFRIQMTHATGPLRRALEALKPYAEPATRRNQVPPLPINGHTYHRRRRTRR